MISFRKNLHTALHIYELLRYIYIYNASLENEFRDDILKSMKKLNRDIYDIRIGKGHMEISSFLMLNETIARLFGNEYRMIDVDSLKNDDLLESAIKYISMEYYWLAHEILENIWHEVDDKFKSTYQFLILLCVANVHEQRGHHQIAKNVINRALKMDTESSLNIININTLKNMAHDEKWNAINLYFLSLN